MAERIWRCLLALTATLSVWTPLAFGHEQAPSPALSVHSSWPTPGQAGAVGAWVLAGMLLAALPLLRRKGGRRSFISRIVARPLAGAVLALLLWMLPWLSLHDTHHALERGAPACQIAQIVHSQGSGILPASVALAPPLLADIVPLAEPVALLSRSAPQPAARSPPA